MLAATPSAGPAGTPVTLYGLDLTGATSVSFGSTVVTKIKVISPTEITTTSPAGSGAVLVTATTPAGTTPSVGAPAYSYATTATGGAGSADLAVSVHDSGGSPVAGATVVLIDTSTLDPVAVETTDTTGSATVRGLQSGATIETDVVAAPIPDGTASSTLVLAKGTNSLTLTVPVVPLVTSDATAESASGSVLATWPEVLPTPGTVAEGATLLANVGFDITYHAGDHVLLTSDPAGTEAFCVDGDWTLTLTPSAGDAPPERLSRPPGAGVPPRGSPLDLASLGLTPGTTYGADLLLTSPQDATTAGSTDIYVLPKPGTSTILSIDANGLSAPAVLGGSTQLEVGSTGTLAVVLQGGGLPGISGYHGVFGFDATGITVQGAGFPAGWGGANRNNYANGDGGFEEGTSSNPTAGTGGAGSHSDVRPSGHLPDLVLRQLLVGGLVGGVRRLDQRRPARHLHGPAAVTGDEGLPGGDRSRQRRRARHCERRGPDGRQVR